MTQGYVQRRLGEDLPVIDLHAHLGRWFNFHIPRHTTADIVAAMDRYGIGMMVASHLKAITGDFVAGNAEAARCAKAFPGRIYAWLGLNPHYPAECRAQMALYGDDARFAGVKLHPETHAYSVLDPLCNPIYEYAAEKRLPVLVHVMGERPVAEFAELCARWPAVTFLMGHSGGPEGWAAAVRAAKALPNIRLDITGSNVRQGLLEWMAAEAGADKITFGTDMPFIDGKHLLGFVLGSGLGAEEKRAVLSGNARQILNAAGRVL